MGGSFHCGASVEILEPRRLLANFYLGINFQPESVPTSVPGYRTDIGRAYRSRANGLTYGWNIDNGSNDRQRNSPLSPDQRFDTLTSMSAGASWGVEVPNGRYNVRLVVGDPNYTPSHYEFSVEGVSAIDRDNNAAEHWQEAELAVTVSDGRLTLTPGSSASHNSICFLEIRSADVGAPVDLSWRYSAPYAPFGRAEPGVVQLGTKLYVMGGFFNSYDSVSERVDVLDMNTKKWSRAATLPGAETHFGATSDGRFIYVVAGQKGPLFSSNSTNAAWKYDPAKDQWTRWIDLPEERYGGALAYVDHAMHFIGGDTTDRVTATNNHWVLDFDHPENGWVAAAPLPVATDHAGHAVFDGKIYVFGGEHDHGRGYFQHSATYSFDPATGKWTQLADMPTASSHFEGNVTIANGEIWVLGGQVDAQLLTDEVRSYNPTADRWTLHTPLLEKRKAGFSYFSNDVIYYGNGDSYHNGQPVSTMITRVTGALSGFAISSAFAHAQHPFATKANAIDQKLFELVWNNFDADKQLYDPAETGNPVP